MTALNRISLLSVLTVALLLISHHAQGADDKKEKIVPILKQWNGSHSGVGKAQNMVVRDSKAWQKLWGQIHAKVSPKPKVPEIDFSKQMVLGAFMGRKNTGGHTIKINLVTEKSKVLQADVVSKSPPPGGFSIQVLTQPYSLVLITKSDKKVQFNEQKKK